MKRSQKIIIITGASSGIGFETARKLAMQNHKVYAFARRLDAMKPLEEFGVIINKLDVTDYVAAQKIFTEIYNKEKRIDVLINNAGFAVTGAIEDVNTEQAKYQFEVNVFALVEITKMIIPYLKKSENAKIINISSMGGRIVFPLIGWYHATKYSVEALSDALRMELAQFGIKVILIEPGAIKTDFYDVTEKYLDEMVEKETPYKNGYIKMKSISGGNNGSDPELISKKISKIIDKKNPKPRYLIGLGAKPLILLKSILSTKSYDKLMKKVYDLK